MSEEPKSLAEDLQKIPVELKRFSQALPDKLLFLLLFAGWVVLFHLLGNSTQGYVKETSLFGWMHYVFTTSEGDELGLYMPAIVLALAYWKREQLIAVRKSRWWPALLLVLAGLAIHVVGYVVQQSRVSIVGFFIGLYGITGLVWGWRWLLATFFPFCLFVFCVPLATETERITLPLRLYATQITAFTCRTILGINVLSDGTQLFDPQGRYQYDIAAACSGIKSLTATVAISLIGGFVFFRAPWRRLVTFLSAFPLAVLGNAIRLVAIVVASEAFGPLAGKYVHDSSWLSLLPYVPAIGGLVLLVKLLQEKELPGASAPVAPPPPVPEPIPVRSSFGRQGAFALVSVWLAVAATGVFIDKLRNNQRMGRPGLKVVSVPSLDVKGNPIGTNSVYLPEKVLSFDSRPMPVAQMVLDLLPKDTTYGQRLYQSADGMYVSTSVVLMGSDRSSIHKPQICLVAQGWKIDRSQATHLVIDRPTRYELPVMRLDLSKERQQADGSKDRVRGIYLYWFVSQDQLTADHLDRQWWMARDLLTQGLLQRWAYVTYFAECPPGLEQVTFERLKNLVSESVPLFQEVQGRPLAGVSDSQSGDLVQRDAGPVFQESVR
ncbi:MAG: exosortase-associated EpsI family protein [Verrucomicrobiales bacterium]|nr:exosortase-associated EpsI family protein [Verrucomicrobiales bacterium]